MVSAEDRGVLRARAPISVVIPAHDAAPFLDACLRHLAHSRVAPLEVIVVDDGSRDQTASIARSHGVTVLSTGGRKGPAHARNVGGQAVRGDILFFIDADVCVHPDTIERIADAFAADRELDAMIGSYDDSPEAPDFISQYKNLMHCFTHQNGRRMASTFWSGCGAIRRHVFLEHSGFATEYGRPAIEDIELGYRLVMARRKVILDRDLLVKHLKRWTLWSLVRTDIVDRGIPWTELILRDGRMPNDLNVQLSQRVSVALALLLVGMAAFAAAWWGGAFLTPLLGVLFFLLCRYWADEADRDPPPSRILWFAGAAGAVVWLAWVNHMHALIPLVALSVLVLALRHRYAYPRARQPGMTRVFVGIYVVVAVLLCLSYLPTHPLVLSICLGALAVLFLNNQFFLFLAARQGRLFALAAIPFQLLYHFYCGVAFLVGSMRYWGMRLGNDRLRDGAEGIRSVEQPALRRP
ncbi:MAG TPA: glycosyltransferase family A protein [Candidatus Binatia bacterium]|nr:glycosyltransferase family A protein [Candidatus Binatia bacterium]